MFGTLTRFELKKNLSSKFFLIALCLLLAVTVLLSTDLYDYLFPPDLGFDYTPMKEQVTYFEHVKGSLQTTGFVKEQYAIFQNMTPEERTAFENAMIEKYGEDVFSFSFAPPDEMMSPPGYFGEDQNDYDYVSRCQLLVDNDRVIREERDRTVRAAKVFGREALEDGDNYGIRRNQNIIRLYTIPQPNMTIPPRGWQELLLDTPFTMLLAFLMVLLSCSGSFTAERDQRTFLLLSTSKNGKGKTMLAKYLAGAISAAVITILFQLAALGGIYLRGGFLGLNQPVTCIQDLRLFPYVMTLGQYILIVLACQIFAAVMLSVLLNTVSALSKSSVISYAAGAILLGVCLLPVFFPPRAELLSGPLSLSSPLKYFDSYYTANLFGFPVLWVVVQAVLWTILGIGCVFLAYKVHYRKRGAV